MKGFSLKPRVRVVAAHRIDTDRLMLRSPEPGDAERVSQLLGNWDVANWLVRVPYPYRLEHAVSWIERSNTERAAGVGFPFIIVERGSNSLVGSVDLSLEEGPTVGTLGYWLGADFWGHGYGTEAARAVIDFAFGPLGLKEVNASALPENERSIRVLEKAGLLYVDRRFEDTIERGRVETAYFSVTRYSRQQR
jgi:RimJ/RimL family protein N-acetyltransferase